MPRAPPVTTATCSRHSIRLLFFPAGSAYLAVPAKCGSRATLLNYFRAPPLAPALSFLVPPGRNAPETGACHLRLSSTSVLPRPGFVVRAASFDAQGSPIAGQRKADLLHAGNQGRVPVEREGR